MKHRCGYTSLVRGMSRPPRGAWIETSLAPQLIGIDDVAPPTGRVD